MYRQQSPYQQPRYQAQAVRPASVLGQVLGITGVGFLVTALASYVCNQYVQLPRMGGFIAMLVGFGLLFAIRGSDQRNPALALLFFYLFAAAEGIGISPIIESYLRIDGPSVVVNAATCTGLGMFCLGLVAYTFSIDWRRFSGVALGLLLGLILVGVISAFTHFLHPGVYAWATLGVFTLLTLIDFSRIRAAGLADSPVLLAVQIYLDALNIFLAFLQIFGNRSQRD
jgi:modulator of FtsH protease